MTDELRVQKAHRNIQRPVPLLPREPEAFFQALLDAARILEADARNDLYEFEMQHGTKG